MYAQYLHAWIMYNYTKLSSLVRGGTSGLSVSCEVKRVPYRDVELLAVESDMNQLIRGTVTSLLSN